MSTRDLAQQIEKAKTKQKEKRKKRNSKCEPVGMALLNRRLGYPPATITDLRINILGEKKRNRIQLTSSNSKRHSPMIFTASFISSSDITRGGANRTLEKERFKKLQNNKSKGRGHRHINVRRLRQNASALQKQTKLPCCPSFDTLRFIDYHRVQQSSASYFCYQWIVKSTDG